MSRKQKSLLIDIGNSTTVLADYDDTAIHNHRSSITETFTKKIHQIDFSYYKKIVISSVVPQIDKLFPKERHIRFISWRNIPLIRINMDIPEQIGADLLVTAVAAFSLYSGPVLVVDSGTALTFAVVDKDGIYQGGLIFPGMKLCSKALQLYTAKIPLITVKESAGLLGKNTKDAVQKGIHTGFTHLLTGTIQAYKQQFPNIKVIGTGKGLELFKTTVPLDDYIPDLILQGLAICAASHITP